MPDVAIEQGWTKEETLESLMRKAGWEGPSSSHHGSTSRRLLRGSYNSGPTETKQPWEEVKDFRVVRYRGLKASATYGEWKDWQNWAASKRPDLWQ